MQKKVEEIIADILNGTDEATATQTAPASTAVDQLLEDLLGKATTQAVPVKSGVSDSNGLPIITVPHDQRIETKDLDFVNMIIGQDDTGTVPGKNKTRHLTVPKNQKIETFDFSLIQKILDEVMAQPSTLCDTTKCDSDCEACKEIDNAAIINNILADLTGNETGITSKNGIFENPEDAVKAAEAGYKELQRMTLTKREELITAIRRIGREHANELARMDLEETGYGRFEDKVRRFNFFLQYTPGTEDIKPEAYCGDSGMTVVEHVPFGVVCCITPSTGVQTTPFHNAICMIAAGNSVVFCPHPNAKKSTLRSIELINEAIVEAGGSTNIITSVENPTFDATTYIIEHPSVKLIVATGGPGIVKKILSSGKKAIGAGAGNPPAFVDATAIIPHAAKSIVAGSHFENGIQCICEKEIVVVDSVADQLIAEMVKEGAYLLKTKEDIDRLTSLVTTESGPNKNFIGKDPAYILKQIGIQAPEDTKTIIFEAPRDHIIATDEYLMSIMPVVRVKDADEGILLSAEYEGGRRHTAMIHSNDIHILTKFAKTLGCTIIVKNGPSFAGVGLGGEGFGTATIAGPTGEGITTPKTFTRMQKCVMVGDFNLLGSYPY